jgi:hypothetical protein
MIIGTIHSARFLNILCFLLVQTLELVNYHLCEIYLYCIFCCTQGVCLFCPVTDSSWGKLHEVLGKCAMEIDLIILLNDFQLSFFQNLFFHIYLFLLWKKIQLLLTFVASLYDICSLLFSFTTSQYWYSLLMGIYLECQNHIFFIHCKRKWLLVSFNFFWQCGKI